MCWKQAIVILITLCLFASPGCGSKNKERRYQELVKKAEVFVAKKKYEEARLSYLSAIDLNPTSADSYFRLADVYVQLKQFGKAVEYYKGAINVDPHHREARLRLAALFAAGSEFEQAESHIRKLLEANPKDVEALIVSATLQSARQAYPEAKKILLQLLIENPKNHVIFASLADISFAEKQYEEGEKYLQQALALDPQNGPVRLALADLYTLQGRLDEAEEILQTVLKSHPDNTGLRYYFGDFLLSRGLADKALHEYEEILSREPLEHFARDRLYDFYLARTNNKSALDLTTALKKSAGESEPAVLYFQGRDAELEGDPEKALSFYLKAIEGMNTFSPVFRRAGIVELSLGKNNEGLEHLNQAVAIDSLDIGARLALARYLLGRKEYGQATEHVKKVLERYPRQLGASVLFADLLLVQGRTKEARVIYEELLKNFSNSPVAYVKLAALEEKENNIPQALVYYQKSLTFDRDVLLPARRFAELTMIMSGREKALEELRNLRDHSKDSKAEYNFLLAQLILAKNDPSVADISAARELYEKAILERPQLLGAYLGLAAMDARERNFKQAAERYKKVLTVRPSDVSSRMLLALTYEQQNEFKSAELEYREILKFQPRFGPAANNLAWLLCEELHGNLDEALELAMVAKEELPNEGSVADTLGWIYHRRGAPRAALPLVEEAVELQKREADAKLNPEVLFHLGAIKAALGDKDGAREALEQAVSIGGEQMPRFMETRKLLDEVRS